MPVIVAATPIEPPDGEFCWTFHLVNESAEPIAEVIVETVSYEWGDSGSSRRAGRVLGPLAPGGCLELLRETATEVRTSLTLRVRGRFGERVLQAKVGRLDRGSDHLVPIPLLGRCGRLATITTREVDSMSGKEPLPKWRRVRTLTVPQASRSGSPFDAGSGIVAYEGRSGGLCAIDVESGCCRWRSQSLRHVVEEVWLDGDLRLCRIDPLTGEPRKFLSDQRWPSLRGERNAFLLGTHTLGCLSWSRRSSDWGNEEPSDFWISLHDIASGERAGSIEHEGDQAIPFPFGDDFIVSFDDRIACFDRVGKQKWSRPEQRSIMGQAEGRVFLSDGKILDVHTGECLAKLDMSYGSMYTSGNALVVSTFEHISMYERSTLSLRWRREMVSRSSIRTTADAVLLLDAPDAGSRHRLVRRVTALDLATGQELASLDVESARGTLDSALIVNGKLVLLCLVGGPPVVIVD